MSAARLTAHQAEVLRKIGRLAARRAGIVDASHIGSRGACKHLIAKGYIAVAVVARGPRGGEYPYYRLTAQGEQTVQRWATP